MYRAQSAKERSSAILRLFSSITALVCGSRSEYNRLHVWRVFWSYNLGITQLLIFTVIAHLSKPHLDAAQERLADFNLECRLRVIVILVIIII